MEKMKFETADMTEKNIDKIAALFPNCVTEMRDENGEIKRGINFEMLRQMLAPDVVDGDECYEFTWVGKKASIAEANKPIRKTLRPCPEESKDWDTTENLYIEGDNLEVLKLLQESYLGKVKMIYIDPPYNTGNDFIYADDFMRSQQEENEQMGMYDEDENRLFKNIDSNGRFHSDWCSMMYPRLMLARNLLSDDGVIFISIDDNEQANLKKICDEVFGESSFVASMIWKSKSGGANDVSIIACDSEYVLVYGKNIEKLFFNLDKNAEVTTSYNQTDENGKKYSLDRLDKQSLGYQPSLDFPITGPDGRIYTVEHKNPAVKVARWRWSKDTVKERYNELVFKYPYVYTKNYEKDGIVPRNLMIEERFGRTRTGKTEVAALFDKVTYFNFPKPTKLIKFLIEIASNVDSVILDFFSGSATTAHAVMQLNAEDGGHRKFIMVQLPEPCDEQSEAYKAGYKNICEIGKERIRRAGEKIKADSGLTAQNLDIGFRVLKLADSNMKDVYYAADEYTQSSLMDMISNIKDDRTDFDLLFGCLIDWGVPLSMPYKSEQLDGCTVHVYNDGDLVACFDENIPESVVRKIAERKPLRTVFRDSGFADSPAKINMYEIFKIYMPEDADDITKRVRVI